MVRKINAGTIPGDVLTFALDELQKILSGEIIFVAQDGRLMQVEITQRRRLADWSEKNFTVERRTSTDFA